MAVAVELAGVTVMGRLYQTLDDNMSTVMQNRPSGVEPLFDMDGDGLPDVLWPSYKFAVRRKAPYAVNENVVGFIYHLGHRPGRKASSGAGEWREVGRRMRLGVYNLVQIQPIEDESDSIRAALLGREPSDQWEMGWFRCELLTSATEYCLQRYLADTSTILDIVDLSVSEIDYAPPGGEVAEHFYSRIEFDVRVDITHPENVHDT